ncbi:hypothetical protein Rleg2_1160 [Rhizobium leguminosarum bv. trifolii WSM2304]|uniref:Holin n=1 Tax=Rhizobium leguminosarum bv. trifolii (strain WSM2304) TaxID=395492 RepID=A0ABF7QKE8_RHILW|nr:hypothetical protein [Rhizobium leguminosarum]ACI54454.1 hypothetical protein Rleg2_1160 [Rhizobium leguminosarum bv. trifolii WSM2304]
MDGFKSFLASRTIWSILVGLLANLFQKYGYTLTDIDQALVVDQILTGVQVVSAIAAIYYRTRATKQITKAA